MFRRSTIPILAFVAVAAWGVFFLPWHIPHSQPVSSHSYIYGFNNFAAHVWIALMLAVLALWRIIAGRKSPSETGFQSALLQVLPNGDPLPVDRKLFQIFLAMATIAMASNAVLFSYLPRAYFGETTYFLSYLDAMVMGLRVYHDFHFDYGPAMLYLPYLFYILSGRLLSLEQSYGIALVLHWSVGLYFIYYIVSCLRGGFSRGILLLAAFLAVFNLTLGLQYTPLRYALPIASIIALHRLVLRQYGNGTAGALKIALAALLIPLVNFAISPEMGLATWLAGLAYFIHLWRSPLRRLTWCLLAVLAAVPVTALCFSSSYFTSILSFSGGGNNFPIFPTAPILLFLVAVLFVVPALAALGFRKSGAEGAIATALVMVTGLLIVPALGRCDTGHVTLNGLGILLLFIAALAQMRTRMIKPVAVIFFIVFAGLNQFLFWKFYIPSFQSIISMNQKLAKFPSGSFLKEVSSNGFHYSKMLPVPDAYDKFMAYPRIGTPLGCDENLERCLKLTGRFVPDYHMAPYMEIYTRPQLQRKFEDMEKMEVIVVPKEAFQQSGPIDPVVQARNDSRFLSDLLLYPVRLKLRNAPFVPNQEILEEIRRRYSPVGTVEGYFIAKRNPEPPGQ